MTVAVRGRGKYAVTAAAASRGSSGQGIRHGGCECAQGRCASGGRVNALGIEALTGHLCLDPRHCESAAHACMLAACSKKRVCHGESYGNFHEHIAAGCDVDGERAFSRYACTADPFTDDERVARPRRRGVDD